MHVASRYVQIVGKALMGLIHQFTGPLRYGVQMVGLHFGLPVEGRQPVYHLLASVRTASIIKKGLPREGGFAERRKLCPYKVEV